MKIADIRVINADQLRCQISLVEVETDTGLIGIGAHRRHRAAVAGPGSDIAEPLLGLVDKVAGY